MLPIEPETSIIERIIEYSNLLFAWKKFKNSSERGDVWHDGFEFVRFEANLRKNLMSIREDVLDGSYRLTDLHELPYPKGGKVMEVGEELSEADKADPCILHIKEKNVALRYRVTYDVAIRDQVLWIAIVNVIGEYFEDLMPEWSYNYRLYRRIWYDEYGTLCKGLFRASDKQLYRKWTQTWPLYKKQISATIRILKSGKGEVEKSNDDDTKTIKDSKDFIYFQSDFFKSEPRKEIYWASLDIKKFYPSVDMELLENKLTELDFLHSDACYCALIKKMLDFKVVEQVEPRVGIPTGLFVAGFLSNVYLLDADDFVRARFEKNKAEGKEQQIAHFRYVDDHVILATNFEALGEWVGAYKVFMADRLKLNFNEDKANYKAKEDGMIPEDAKLNTDYPTPLMTISLQKLSALSRINVELLTKREFDLVLMDLQQMLVTDIPEDEIKRETRISFAITMLSRIIVEGDIDWDELYRIRKSILGEIRKRNSGKDAEAKDGLAEVLKALTDDNMPAVKVHLKKPIKDVARYNEVREKEFAKKDQLLVRIFGLIKYALNEEPNKPKIWLRALQFIYRHPNNGAKNQMNISQLVELLNRQKEGYVIHAKSHEYLMSALMTEVAIMLLRHLYMPKYAAVNEMAYTSLMEFLKGAESECPLISKSAVNVAKCAILYYEKLMGLEHQTPLDDDETMYAIYALSEMSHDEEAFHQAFHNSVSNWKKSPYCEQYMRMMVGSRVMVEELSETEAGISDLNMAYEAFGFPAVEVAAMANLNSQPQGDDLYKYISSPLRYHERIKLMILIAQKVKEMGFANKDYGKINVYNFFIGKESVTYEERVDDKRCVNLLTGKKDSFIKPLYQLGILFYQILAARPFIPEILNGDQTELVWNRYLMRMYKECVVSSFSMSILRSCLSDRNLETIYWGKSRDMKMDDMEDITSDPPIFLNVDDFIAALEQERRFLRRYEVKEISEDGEAADDVILMQVTDISKIFNPLGTQYGQEEF